MATDEPITKTPEQLKHSMNVNATWITVVGVLYVIVLLPPDTVHFVVAATLIFGSIIGGISWAYFCNKKDRDKLKQWNTAEKARQDTLALLTPADAYIADSLTPEPTPERTDRHWRIVGVIMAVGIAVGVALTPSETDNESLGRASLALQLGMTSISFR